VPSPKFCWKTWVDLDRPAVDVVDQIQTVDPGADLVYDGCGHSLAVPQGVSVGYAEPGPLHPGRCSQLARSRRLGQSEPITSIKVGTVLCAVTNKGAVVSIKVVGVGAPYQDDGDMTAPKPTLVLDVTAWIPPSAEPS
jgi:hypothetical protein